ncbi:MAG: glycoside hydrolase family 44 protein [Vicinamibacteria bacterium]
MRAYVPLRLLLLSACAGAGSPAGPEGAPSATPAFSVRLTVDTAAARQPISPYVYGHNQADWNRRHRGLRLGRLGGNRWTAYNWETNASNAGSDFRHQNDAFLGGGDVAGEAVRPHVAAGRAAGAAMVVTVPMAGYVSADKRGDGDVSATPGHLETRFHESLPQKPGALRYPPDTGDRVVYQDEFVAWVEATFPRGGGPPIFYSLDNEPDLWASTHARIRPTGPVTYAEVVERTTDWAQAVKWTAPDALVFGPVNYGWQGFVRLQNAPDARGRDFLDVYLAEMAAAGRRFGRPLVDVLDVHWYPEARGGGVRVTEASGADAVAAARVQAPRSLWDPSYVEASWIAQDAGVGAIRLLPRLREKVAARAPGTRLAMTEYNYGGGDHISGGIAQADVLGIFGREGVFAAAFWSLAESERFADAGFAAYCDFDGAGGRFGDTSVAAQTSDLPNVTVYASVTADDRVVVVAINKSPGAAAADLTVAHPADLRAQAYALTSASPAMVRAADPARTGRNQFRLTLAGSSVTTIALTR